MTTSESTRLARQVVADLGRADAAPKRLGVVPMLMADEVDHWLGWSNRLSEP
jgi:hypothetical protein